MLIEKTDDNTQLFKKGVAPRRRPENREKRVKRQRKN
jgi:hypothetical protein